MGSSGGKLRWKAEEGSWDWKMRQEKGYGKRGKKTE